MPSFPAPGKEKNHGKTAARDTFRRTDYPHALEKSQNIFQRSVMLGRKSMEFLPQEIFLTPYYNALM